MSLLLIFVIYECLIYFLKFDISIKGYIYEKNMFIGTLEFSTCFVNVQQRLRHGYVNTQSRQSLNQSHMQTRIYR